MTYVERAPFNVEVPRNVLDEIRHLSVLMHDNKREYWVTATAALMMFIEASPEEQRDWIKRVRDAQAQAGYERLLDDALSERARKHASGKARSEQQEPHGAPGREGSGTKPKAAVHRS